MFVIIAVAVASVEAESDSEKFMQWLWNDLHIFCLAMENKVSLYKNNN